MGNNRQAILYIRLLGAVPHLLVWGLLYYVLSPLAGLVKWGPIFEPIHGQIFLSYGTVLNAILIYTYAHLALPEYFRSKDVVQFLLLNIAYLSGFVLLETCLDYMYTQVLFHVVPEDYTGKVFPGFLKWLETNFIITLGYMVAANLYGFSYGWFYEQKIRGELEEEKLRAELSALKHQINPHFLFNILNSLYGMALVQDDELTANGISRLSSLMRYVLYESNESTVPLQGEIDYVYNYIELQRMRLGEQTEVLFELTGDPSPHRIAPMIFIPFIENAFKHGVSTIHSSTVHIKLSVEPKRLTFYLSNPQLPLRKKDKNYVGGIGLQNVRKRLALIYPKKHTLSLGPADELFIVTLTIEL